MEAISLRTALVTALAPVAWGSSYFVTRHFLPADAPIYGAALRALPAGLLLLAVSRTLPRGSWWWRSALVSFLTVGGFFVLVYVAGLRLPSGVASNVMAMTPAAVMLLAWPLTRERPKLFASAGAIAGLLGVTLLVGGAPQGLDAAGVAAAALAMLTSSLGFVLTKRWKPPVGALTFASWQLVLGGLMMLPVAVALEGRPPQLAGDEVLAFAYVGLVATAAAYVAWFNGLRKLPVGTVGLLGLLNPLAGTALGVLAAGERFSLLQMAGGALIVGGVALGLVRPRSGATRAGVARADETRAEVARVDRCRELVNA